MIVLGLDPGLKGALALLNEDEKILAIEDIPTLAKTKTRRAIDAQSFIALISDWRSDYGEFNVIAEAPQIRGGQAGALTVGRNFGLLEGLFVARYCRFETCAAQTWQSRILGKDRGKDSNRLMAQSIWPEADLGKRKSQDRSDAALIALFGIRKSRGEIAR